MRPPAAATPTPAHGAWQRIERRAGVMPHLRHSAARGARTRARHGRRNGFARDFEAGGIALGDDSFPERFRQALTPALETGREAARVPRNVEPRESVMQPDLTRMSLPDGAEDDLPVGVSDEDRGNAEYLPGGAIEVTDRLGGMAPQGPDASPLSASSEPPRQRQNPPHHGAPKSRRIQALKTPRFQASFTHPKTPLK